MSKVVIVEDNQLVARLYENKLLAAGHTVKVAFDGVSGFELIKDYKPNLVLLDLMLPKRSGVEVIEDIRKDRELTNVPLIAFSSGDESTLDLARAAGATRIVSKNEISLRGFFEELNQMLENIRHWQVYDSSNLDDLTDESKRTANFRENVLIVEDDKIIAAVVKDVVEKQGFEAVTVSDGREAYKILAENANFAAAFFDVQVPFIKGPDLLRYMRTEKRLMRIPVLIMTSDESVRVQLESLAAGAAVFVPKPFQRQTLNRCLWESSANTKAAGNLVSCSNLERLFA